MPSLNLITTTAGRAAILAGVAGPSTVFVEDAQLSDVDQAVTVATTALTDVVATLDAAGVVRAAGDGHALHVVITDDSDAAYDVRTLALRLTGGVLLMVYSQASLIATKVAGSSLHLALDLTVDADTAATLNFGDTDYTLPAGSEDAPGLLELATAAEVIAGVDTVRAVTPAGLAGRTATDTRAGLVELATGAEVITGTDTTRAITPAGLVGRTATDARVGLVELATDAEAITGTDTARAVTPAALAAKLADVFTGPRKVLLSPGIFKGAAATYDGDKDLLDVAANSTVAAPLDGLLPDGATITQIRIGVDKGGTGTSSSAGVKRNHLAPPFPGGDSGFGLASSALAGVGVLDSGDTSSDPNAVLDLDAALWRLKYATPPGQIDTIRWVEISYSPAFNGKR